jgi:hypothetical protein
MYCVRSERRRSLMKYAMNGSSVMVALFAIHQLSLPLTWTSSPLRIFSAS